MAKDTPRGVAGNAQHKNIPLRDWSMGSYNADTGRSHSSVAEYGGEAPLKGNYAGKCNPQIPDKWKRDQRATQDRTPVSRRPFTKAVD